MAGYTDVVPQITLKDAHIDFDNTTRSMARQSARTPSINSPTFHSTQIPSAPGDPLQKGPVYVGRDPCHDMEVVIKVGECKSHVAVVRSTRKQGDTTLVDVRTTTKLENVDLTLEISDMMHLQ
jgi:transcription elongation factor